MSAKSSAVASMDPMTCSTSTKETLLSRFIVKPATGQAQLTRNCLSRPLRLNEGPRFQLEISIDRVAVVVLDQQYDTAHKMLDHLRLYSKGLQYCKWRPVPENGNRYCIACMHNTSCAFVYLWTVDLPYSYTCVIVKCLFVELLLDLICVGLLVNSCGSLQLMPSWMRSGRKIGVAHQSLC